MNKTSSVILRSLLSAVVVTSVLAQQRQWYEPDPPEVEITTSEVAGIINPQGWVIPQVKAQPYEGRAPLKRLGGSNSKTIYYLYHAIGEDEEVLLDVTEYYAKSIGARKNHRDLMRIHTAEQYDVNGKVFCYSFIGYHVVMDKTKQGWVRATLGTGLHGIAFYDEDGDGKFEKLAGFNVNPLPSRKFKIHAPAWVLK